MSLTLEAKPLPLRQAADGVIRIGRTRVTLDSVVRAHRQGASAEEIAAAFDSVGIEDIYAVLAYYLAHRTEVEQYLAEREAEAERVRRENEARFPPRGVRERLLARKRGPDQQC